MLKSVKSIAFLSLVVILSCAQAVFADGVSDFARQFPSVCAMQMQQQASTNGLSLPADIVQSYCNCTAQDVASSARANPVLMKMLNTPSTPADALEGYMKSSANKCAAQYLH